MVVIEIDGKLYDTNDKVKIEDLIRKMLVEIDRKNNIKRLYK